MEIRTAAPGDLDGALAVEQAAFPPAEAAGRASVEGRIARFPGHFLLAVDDGRIAAFINGFVTDSRDLDDEMYDHPELHNEKGAWQMIFSLACDPARRGRGYASALMERFISDAWDQGRRGLVLTCKDHMVGFYRRFGFVDEGMSGSTHGGVSWHQMRLTFETNNADQPEALSDAAPAARRKSGVTICPDTCRANLFNSDGAPADRSVGKIKVWTKQNAAVADILERQGRYIVKEEYIGTDLDPQHRGFVLDIYRWLADNTPGAESRPADVSYPVWVSYRKEGVMLPEEGFVILELELDPAMITPVNIAKWGSIMNYSYLPKDEKDAARHKQLLRDIGVTDAQAYMSRFYPEIKEEIRRSWKRLFDDSVILQQDRSVYGNIWEVRSEWVTQITG